ncbi:hypothetical protein [Flavobacterium sp. 25HG05S-40]|uniref:hypothetical protein n=1 Tax=Flavobacterium sp. 25HG05S-40 TaxID=3458682 RepID=UPI0040446C87
MKKNIVVLLFVVFGCLTLGFFSLFVKRWNLPYTSEGTYFDEASLITYKEQAAEVYGIIAFVCFLFTGLLLYKMMLFKKH